MKEPDLSLVVPAEDMRGDDLQDTHLLNQSLEEATLFLGKFKWCTKVVRRFFGLGVGGVVAVFLFEIVPSSPDVDRLLWVVAGDIPPAYLMTDDAPTPQQALGAYVEEMSTWVAAVREGRSVEDLIPVNVEPTKKNAERLAKRLEFISEQFLTPA
jgi:hypothetical protein